MAKKDKKRKEIKRKLLHKYRLVILNESTFEEKISFKLSRLNVFVTGTLAVIGLIAFTTVLIAFTPLREYIPGYSSTALKRQATELTYKTDSLLTVLNYTNKYIDNIRMVLSGDIENNQANEVISTHISVLANTMGAYSAITGNNMNRIMKVLTVFSILLAPPAIMAAYYGTNLALPFQQMPGIFWLAVGAGFLPSVIGLLIFRKMGWI